MDESMNLAFQLGAHDVMLRSGGWGNPFMTLMIPGFCTS